MACSPTGPAAASTTARRSESCVSPSPRPAAAAGRRAGPVLAPLRAADPAAAHDEGADDRERRFSGHRATCI
jgi:hypothetical protein